MRDRWGPDTAIGGSVGTPASRAMIACVEDVMVTPVFIGRDEEMATLTRALADAASGESRMVLVGGEAGVGKSRLVEELAAVARSRGALVAVGGCVETGAEEVPFAAPLAALRSALRQSAGGSADDIGPFPMADLPTELSGIMPELGHVAPQMFDSGASFLPNEGPARLFELTLGLLERLSAERALVLVLEDLQWADASTRHLLLYLFRSLRSGRVLIIGTYRSDELHRRHPLRPFLAEAARLRNLLRIVLPAFTWDEVKAQVTALLGAPADPWVVDRILARSDGNAFFVEELVHAGRLGPDAALHDTLRDLLLARLHALPDAAQEVVRIAAVSGGAVPHTLLRAASDLPETELIEAVRAVVDSQIFRATPDGYRFRHTLVREAADDEVLPGERARLSRRSAEALEAHPTLAPAEEYSARLAGYWAGAHEPARAFTHYVTAAAEAKERYACTEQLHLLTRAMELWETIPEAARSALRAPGLVAQDPALGAGTEGCVYTDLLAEAVVAARMSGEWDRGVALSRKALALPDSQVNPLRRAWFWTEHAQLVEDLGLGDGKQELDHAQDLVRELPSSAVHADVLARIAAWGARHQPGPDSLQAAERAVGYAREVGDAYGELNARVTRAWLLTGTDEFKESVTELRQVLRRAKELRAVALIGRVSIMLPSVLEGLGRSAEALTAGDESAELCRGLGLANVESWVHTNRALSLFSLGRWPESARAAEEAARLARSRKARGIVAALNAEMESVRGESREAERYLSAARELYGTRDPQPQLLIPLATVAVRIAARQGRLGDARRELFTALSGGLPATTVRYSLPLLHAAAAAEADAWVPGRNAERDHVIAAVRAHAAVITVRVPVWQAYQLMIEAELARAQGDPSPEAWARAVDVLTGLERPYELAFARSRWAADALAVRTPRPNVAPVLHQAWETARSLGARQLHSDIEVLARRGGIALPKGDELSDDISPTSRQPSATGGPSATVLRALTVRETEVLRLVARGYSNGRIATALFISQKTVSAHVSHILAKLGVTSRTEAAALAHRLGFDGVEEPGEGEGPSSKSSGAGSA
ncbi:AAA family ATPase [Streptomyces sp. PA03-6a]|nr:AAA family ATPase [Streptomyces sp. PA03-6a]